MIVQENGYEFEVCHVDREVIITVRRNNIPGKPHTAEEINATFSLSKANDCEDAIAAAIDNINGEGGTP